MICTREDWTAAIKLESGSGRVNCRRLIHVEKWAVSLISSRCNFNFALSPSGLPTEHRFPRAVNHGAEEETHGPRHRRANRDPEGFRMYLLARLTLYCGRIYEIRGEGGIPPFTYARTFTGRGRSVTSAGRRPIQYVNLLDLSDCPYSLSAEALAGCRDSRICVTLLLQIADPGKMSHFVSFPGQRTRLQHAALTRARACQSPAIDSNVSQIVGRTMG